MSRDRDDFIERKIIIGMIVHDDYLRRVFSIYKEEYFESDEAVIVSKWCIEYFRHYKKAPGKEIELIYESKAKRINDRNQKDLIEAILDTLSNEWEQATDEFNAEYLFDKTVEYFKIRSYGLLSDNLKIAYGNYDMSMGEQMLNEFSAVSAITEQSTLPLTDQELFDSAFENDEVPLFELPGAIGVLLNSQLVQEGFISLMGHEKIGKSWWLMELALRSCRHGVPTALIQAGDMSTKEMFVRIQVRLARKSNREKYCGELFIPVIDCFYNQSNICKYKQRICDCGINWTQDTKQEDGECGKRKREKTERPQPRNQLFSIDNILSENVGYTPCSECYNKSPSKFRGAVYWKKRESVCPLTPEEAKENSLRIEKVWRAQPRISTHPAGSLSVSGIKSLLDTWERDLQYTPKVIVIDYADLLIGSNKDFRHNQNEIWRDLRGLAQERKCLVITATQADAASYNVDTIGMSNFSEDKRKLSHVTAMLGLNQTNIEKRKGIMRLNLILARNDAFNSGQCVSVLQCLETGQPLIASYFA